MTHPHPLIFIYQNYITHAERSHRSCFDFNWNGHTQVYLFAWNVKLAWAYLSPVTLLGSQMVFISAISSSVKDTSKALRFASRWLIVDVPGRGMTKFPWAWSQARAIWPINEQTIVRQRQSIGKELKTWNLIVRTDGQTMDRRLACCDSLTLSDRLNGRH